MTGRRSRRGWRAGAALGAGTQAGYHSITQGFILGEVIRRITDRDPAVFFAEEVAGPLGVDFHQGLDRFGAVGQRGSWANGGQWPPPSRCWLAAGPRAACSRRPGADLDAWMSVAYVMNQMLDETTGGHRGFGIVMAAYEGLG